jgi:anti-sigma B factor antagonist
VAALGPDGTPGLAVQVRRDGSDCVVAVAGDLDVVCADQLRQEVAKAVATSPQRLVFDLSALRFIDSAGLAVLIEASSGPGTVRIRDPSPAVVRVIELTGLENVLVSER